MSGIGLALEEFKVDEVGGHEVEDGDEETHANYEVGGGLALTEGFFDDFVACLHF